jgi:hypothetical protein
MCRSHRHNWLLSRLAWVLAGTEFIGAANVTYRTDRHSHWWETVYVELVPPCIDRNLAL